MATSPPYGVIPPGKTTKTIGLALPPDGLADGAASLYNYAVDEDGNIYESTPCPGDETNRTWSKINPALATDVVVAPGTAKQQAQTLMAVLRGGEEALRNELLPYLETRMDGMTVLRSPLVYSVPHMDELNALMNRQFEQKRDMVDAAIARGDLDQALWLYEKPFRAQQLAEWANTAQWESDSVPGVFAKNNSHRWWTMVRETWMSSENIFQNMTHWKEIFLQSDCFKASTRHLVMDNDDILRYKELDDIGRTDQPINVHRGQVVGQAAGWSWTTDHAKARWFANRASTLEGGTSCVVSGVVVHPEHLIACFGSRGEAEVVVDPARATKLETVKVTRWQSESDPKRAGVKP